jgi:hypothetical protein
LGSYGAGAFAGQADSSLEVYTEQITVEGIPGFFYVEYMCSCGLPVVKLTNEINFACIHCDSVCAVENCKDCVKLLVINEDEEKDEDGDL